MLSKLPVNSPIREYVYDILYHLPQDDRFKLQGKYYNIGRTNATAKNFCNTARLEELQHVLTLLGVEWYMVFFPKTFVGGTNKMLEELVDENSQLSTLRNIIKKKIFVTGSKQFATLLATMSQSTYSGVYVKNLQLEKFAYHHRKWSKGINSGATKDESDVASSLKYFGKHFFNTIMATKRSDYLDQDLIVLLYLYSEQHTFVEFAKIVEDLADAISTRKVSRPIRRLLNKKVIQKHPKKKAYTITTSGVLDVNKVIEDVLKANRDL